jgi:hypothetical protein
MATLSKPPPAAETPGNKAAQDASPEPSGAKSPAAPDAPAAASKSESEPAAEASAPKPAVSAAKPAAPAAKPAAPVQKPAPPEPAPASAEVREPLAAPLTMLSTPKDVGALPGPIGDQHFAGELEESFEKVLASVDLGKPVRIPPATWLALRVAEPVLGALSDRTKADIEEAVGNLAGFSRVRSTVLNMVLNALVYPVVLVAAGMLLAGEAFASIASVVLAVLGVAFAVAEAVGRTRPRILRRTPAEQTAWRVSCYGFLLAPLGRAVLKSASLRPNIRRVPFEGYTVDLYDEKTERERRYGTVYTVSEHANAYLVRLEMPRKIPPSSLKRLWKLPDEMPDYEYNISISLGGQVLTIQARLRGETLRRLASVSPSFPADFVARIDFEEPVSAFRHRLRDKVLEIIVLKAESAGLQAAAWASEDLGPGRRSTRVRRCRRWYLGGGDAANQGGSPPGPCSDP